MTAGLLCRPVGADSWRDVVALFGENGAYANCWCTWFLFTSRAFDQATHGQRRRTLEERVCAGRPSGVLAYLNAEPVGWCAIGPRQDYERLTSPRARSYRSIDGRPTWVITCFYIPKAARGQGIATTLLVAAVDYARREGVTTVDAYPVDLDLGDKPASSLYRGTLSMFTDAGFVEIARHGDTPQVRLDVQ